MSPLNTPVVPVKMEQARQQLERWRSTRAHRSPIPEPLWALAVQLARRYGIFATARALRLDYTRLKHGWSLLPALRGSAQNVHHRPPVELLRRRLWN